MSESILRGGMPVNFEQDAIIEHVIQNSLTVVSASAGSGKTHTTIAAVLELAMSQRAMLDQFVLITFTQKAAGELRKRIQNTIDALVADEHAMDVRQRRAWREQQELLSSAYIGTIHGFCHWLLRTYGYAENVAHLADVITTATLLSNAIKDEVEAPMAGEIRGQAQILLQLPFIWHEYDLRDALRKMFEKLRGYGLETNQMLAATQRQRDDVGKPYRLMFATLLDQINQRYRAQKQEQHKLDPQDLLNKTVTLLKRSQGQTIAAHVGKRYRYLFIDEFQDTDRLQKTMVDLLLPHMEKVLAVGDPKQSIYGFRAADVSLLQKLADKNSTAVLRLRISRRPTKQLLGAQNALFQNIGKRFSMLNDEIQSGDSSEQVNQLPPIRYLCAGKDVTQQALKTRDSIQELLEEGYQSGDIALLLRTNDLVAKFEQQLKQLLGGRGIAVRAERGGGLFAQPEIIATFRMLNLLLTYPDDAALAMALDTPYLHHVEAQTRIRDILQYGFEEGRPLVDWLKSEYATVRERLAGLRKDLRILTVPQLMSKLYDTFGILSYYQHRGDAAAKANLEKLRELARHLFNENQALTLRVWVEWLRDAIRRERQEEKAVDVALASPQTPTHIRLMTIHQAKGLEFPVVIMPQIQESLSWRNHDPYFLFQEDGSLDLNLEAKRGAVAPETRTKSDRFDNASELYKRHTIEEEMRLFYVAVTRAKEIVIFLGSKRPIADPIVQQFVPDPHERDYAWQDEIIAAQRALVAHGVRFER